MFSHLSGGRDLVLRDGVGLKLDTPWKVPYKTGRRAGRAIRACRPAVSAYVLRAPPPLGATKAKPRPPIVPHEPDGLLHEARDVAYRHRNKHRPHYRINTEHWPRTNYLSPYRCRFVSLMDVAVTGRSTYLSLGINKKSAVRYRYRPRVPRAYFNKIRRCSVHFVQAADIIVHAKQPCERREARGAMDRRSFGTLYKTQTFGIQE
ncbi:hypothetical protein EVAR_44923_1 [Eumeta japonica]|uniref:Uncharacterized protein n=1 Tax=Eumeta variegata TaxID=151549 RepID=A0A4C1XJ76_EUMVA|nr:hypothetical protein EVAR_44923_1 [Eumeta japonica]